MTNDNADYLKLVHEYLKPFEGKINYSTMYNGFIDYARFFTYAKILSLFCNLKDAKVLDAGCGAGGMSVAMELFGAEPVGFDIEMASIRMSTTRLPKGNFLVTGGLTVPFTNEKFDAISLLHVIEHVDNPQKVVDEAFRVLKHGGILLMETPNRFYPYEPHQKLPIITIFPKNFADLILTFITKLPVSNDLKNRCESVKDLLHFISTFTLKKLANRAGFEVVGSNEVYTKIKSSPKTKKFSFQLNNDLVIPIIGDWGGTRKDTVGWFNDKSKEFNLLSEPTKKFSFSINSSKYIPVSGDWNGDGIDSIGLYDPSTNMFYLKNTNSSGNADIVFNFGNIKNAYPICGDWNGDGIDSIGLYDPSTGTFYLKNTNSSGIADIDFSFGKVETCLPLVGDWSGKGYDSIGLYDKKSSMFFLKNSNSIGDADGYFKRDPPTEKSIPIVGDWDGDGKDTIGFFSPDGNCILFGVNDKLQEITPKKYIFEKIQKWNFFGVNTLIVAKKP